MQDMHWEMKSRTESRYKNEMKEKECFVDGKIDGTFLFLTSLLFRGNFP